MPELRPKRQEPSKGWVARTLAGSAISAVAKHVAVTWLIPFGSAFVTGLSGYLQGYPWMILLVASGFMFATVTTGLVRFDDWLERRRVNGKLRFEAVRVARDIRGGGYLLGVVVSNAASVPVEFEVTGIQSKLSNRVPTIAKYDVTNITIPPHGIAWYNDHPIDVGAPPSPGVIEGLLDLRMQYGRPGSLKYELIVRKQVVLLFNEHGLPTDVTWGDMA